MTTLRQVAERAGVSLATASRVATGSARVRSETRARVERAMRDLLYVRAGENHRPVGMIGLLVPQLTNPVFPALAQAMERRAMRLGLAPLLCNTGGSSTTEAEYVHMLLGRRVDGMIFISCEGADLNADHSHYALLLGKGAKLVCVNGAVETLSVPSVGVDERASGQLATEHLIALGHRRIGFVAGPSHYVPTALKGAGHRLALTVAGLPEGPVAHAEFTVEGGSFALRKLLDAPATSRPTGVICSNDLMAIGALLEARLQGVRVPKDLSIVGFDGIDATNWTQPTLTTVEQPIHDIAETAVDALHSLIQNPERPLPEFRLPAPPADGSLDRSPGQGASTSGPALTGMTKLFRSGESGERAAAADEPALATA